MNPRLLILFTVLMAALTAACDAGDDLHVPREAPPAAAVVAPGVEMESLDRQLRQLEEELARAEAGEPQRLLAAEAVTDRLVHAERSVDWLATGYDVEARLRQLQAMADRVVALLRRGASIADVSPEIETMARAVTDLRGALGVPGGGAAPPRLDSLLAQDPMKDAEAPSLQGVLAAQDSAEAARPELPDIEPEVEPVESGALGTPVSPPDTGGG